MKKLIFILLLCLPVLSMAQKPKDVDTVTYERDTIVKFKVNGEYRGHVFLVVDSLTGTLDGLVELVVADDVDSETASETYPDDSVFVKLSANMVDTLTANGSYSFYWDEPISYDYFGVKLTLNNITKWHIYWKKETYILNRFW